MNSVQKQTQNGIVVTHETFLVSFDQNLLNTMNLKEIEILMKKLQFLGLNFDPFSEEVKGECLQVMDSIGLTDHLKNPYLATNMLLQLLDKTEERINKLKQ